MKLVPDFSKYQGRNADKELEVLAENSCKQDIDPNKEFVMSTLNKGSVNWNKTLGREEHG